MRLCSGLDYDSVPIIHRDEQDEMVSAMWCDLPGDNGLTEQVGDQIDKRGRCDRWFQIPITPSDFNAHRSAQAAC
jgi:hypothetical protein